MSSSKRHFTVVMNSKEHGLYISSTPSSAARKAVSKLCANNKKKKVEFCMRETTHDSNKKVYGPYIGYMQKLDKPLELEGRIIQYKPIVKLKKKNRKMKGGVIEILGKGEEGIVLRPNINQSPNNKTTVSKLIKATKEQKAELIAFENELNSIDDAGRYHVKMLSCREISSENIKRIPNINQAIMNKMEKYNFKITYQYGGISIEHFLKNFLEGIIYKTFVDSNFIIHLLKGISNCFQGLYVFYEKRIIHLDLHDGNIVFLLYEPEIMRIIDWGYLLGLNNSLEDKKYNMNESLFKFYLTISDLLNKLKINSEISKILDDFLNIQNFLIYESRSTARILTKPELDGIIGEMDEIIDNFSKLSIISNI